MQEEIFISGRNIPKIDPYLEIWHFPISLYLFLGGMAAGIIFFASLFTVLRREKEVQTAMLRQKRLNNGRLPPLIPDFSNTRFYLFVKYSHRLNGLKTLL